jgi:membrane protein implicated in regulation of membrane protease activity
MNDPMLIWLIIGGGLCSIEFFFPTAFVTFMMGLGALAVAAIIFLIPISPNLQIALWMLFSTTAVILSRRFFTPKTATRTLSDDTEAETLTAITPGKTGRVLYEGNSWRARCADETIEIDPHETVYVVRQEGTTLFVMPRHLLQ